MSFISFTTPHLSGRDKQNLIKMVNFGLRKQPFLLRDGCLILAG